MDILEIELIKNSEEYKQLRAIEKETQERDEAVYSRLKDRPSVRKLIEIGGFCHDSGITLMNIEKIDELLNDGWNYSEGCTRGITCELAFFLHLEEKLSTNITSAKQFHELAQFNQDNMAETEMFYHTALARLYSMALGKIIHNGGKYADLLTIDPKAFGLPDKWRTFYSDINTKQDIIYQVLLLYIEDSLFSQIEPMSLLDVAIHLEAPYSEIIKASNYYSD